AAGVIVLALTLHRSPEDRARQDPETASVPPAGETVLPESESQGETLVIISEFERFVGGGASGQPEASIKGEEAVAKRVEGRMVYLIKKPQVISLVPIMDGPGGGSVRNARLTAERAEFDESKGVLRLFDTVTLEGEEFKVVTDNVTYIIADRSLGSDAGVELKQFRPGSDGLERLAMHVTGRGLAADITLRDIKILHEPVARLLQVSGGFLQATRPGVDRADGASTGSPDRGAEEKDVVIVAEGPMTYQHLAQKLRFENKVVSTYGESRLACGSMEIVLDTDGAEEELQVSEITAEESVVFSHEGQDARGDRLEWHNLSHVGILTGQPARIIQPELWIETKKLTFFKVDRRFTGEGPGELTYLLPEAPEPSPSDAGAGAEDREPAPPMLLTTEGPIKVTWQKSMRYDAVGGEAIFSGEVVARRGKDDLLCKELELRFDENDQVDTVTAVGNVRGVQTIAGEQRLVECDRAVWNYRTRAVSLWADKGKEVTVSSKRVRLVASKADIHPDGNMLKCEGPGSLAMAAEDGADGGSDEQPIEVRWSSSMLFSGTGDRYAEFEGQVTALRPGEKVSADHVRVDFDAGMNAAKITATGNAVLEVRGQPDVPAGEAEKNGASEASKAPAETDDLFAMPTVRGGVTQWRLSGDEIVGEPAKDLLRVSGPGELEVPKGEAESDVLHWSERMTIDLGKLYAQFEGKVDGVFSGSKLGCDRSLRLEFNEARKLRNINAKGNVSFQAAGATPWQLDADEALAIFAAENVLDQIIAFGHVDVKDQGRSLLSDRLLLYFASSADGKETELDRARATGNVSIRYDEKDIEADGEELAWNAREEKYTLKGSPARVRSSGATLESSVIHLDRPSGVISLPRGARPIRTRVETQAP
ncbi:MAG: LptA/OstA family protein, partial [Candidatus Brocadiia bacterium]|nr:LptA/OstA family protein [Candidatus Brocadiia bacterium]